MNKCSGLRGRPEDDTMSLRWDAHLRVCIKSRSVLVMFHLPA